MAEHLPKRERQMNLVALLLKTRIPVSRAQIVATVDGYRGEGDPETLTRRFERDKAELAALGLAIEHQAPGLGEPGYVIAKEQCLLPPVSLTPDERVVLERLARRFRARAEGGGVLGENLATALMKLKFDASVSSDEAVADFGVDADAEESAFFRVGLESARETPLLDALLDATLARHTVSFRYSKLDAGPAEARTLDPWALVFAGGFWYVHGRCHDRGEPRTFKLVRIDPRVKIKRKTRAAGPDFAVPSAFDREAVARALEAPLVPFPAAAGEDGPLRVRLGFSPEVAFMVVAQYPAIGTYTTLPDGGGELAFEARPGPALWRFYLEYAPHVRVLEPEHVRSAFASDLKRLRARYASAGAPSGHE